MMIDQTNRFVVKLLMMILTLILSLLSMFQELISGASKALFINPLLCILEIQTPPGQLEQMVSNFAWCY